MRLLSNLIYPLLHKYKINPKEIVGRECFLSSMGIFFEVNLNSLWMSCTTRSTIHFHGKYGSSHFT